MARKVKRKQKRSRAKAIRLSREIWLRNAKEIKEYRDTELMLQEGRCVISGIPLDEDTRLPVLDHCHSAGEGTDGKVRGVLLSEINMLEGKYLKLFRRMKLDEKYGLTFPTFLINMGEYLLQDNSERPLHFKYMSDFRDYIKRFNRITLVSKLKKDFNIDAEPTEAHNELVRLYIQAWVDIVEYKEQLKDVDI
jgi:hypothetical protein